MNMIRVLIAMLCCMAYGHGQEKARVCLNMIVKNERHIISRCLDSVKPYIDYWVIVDTGSTDGTQEMIREYLAGIPGELFERPWEDFSHNRNEALSYARGKAEYALIMDADDYLEADPGKVFPQLTEGAYLFPIVYGSMTYSRYQLISLALPWRWEGVVHETVVCPIPYTSATISGIRYVIGSGGARSLDPQKYVRDAAVLAKAVQEDPSNARSVFYLAQSYQDAGNLEESLRWYKRRIAMGGWEEEVYISLLRVAYLMQQLGSDTEALLDAFEHAHRYRPHRVEALYGIVSLLNETHQYEMAYVRAREYAFLHQPADKDLLFTLDWMAEYGLLFQQSIAAYYVGEREEFCRLCDTLLAMKHFPWKEQVLKNRAFLAS